MPALQLDANGALDLDTIYEPYPKQRQLHTNSAKNLLAIGGNGSGKSAFLLGESLYVAFEYPGSSCLLLRRDFHALFDSMLVAVNPTSWRIEIAPRLESFDTYRPLQGAPCLFRSHNAPTGG